MSTINTKLVEGFLDRVSTMPLEELKNIKKSINRTMTSGKSVLGDIHSDYAVLYGLMQRIRELEAQPLSPEGEALAEARKLAREHGVSVKIAEAHLQRQRERDPLDVARTQRKPAPDPEPAMPDQLQRHIQEQPDLRPHRIRG